MGPRPRVHSIPFGPLRNKKIYMAPHFSPRMWFGINEPSLVPLCKQYIKPSFTIFDIGAHVGYTTLLFAHFLNNSGTIHAFEILPFTADFLAKTVEANNLSQVTIHRVGLGVKKEIITLPIGQTAMTSMNPKQIEGTEHETCMVAPLDDYKKEAALPNPDLIKMDIEGAEIDCLMGGINLIAESRPIMFIAFHSHQLLVDGVNLLSEFGYTFHRKQETLTREKINQLQDPFNENILCLPG